MPDEETKPSGWRDKHPILNMAINKLDSIEQHGAAITVLQTNVEALEHRVSKLESQLAQRGKRKKKVISDVEPETS